ncbi:MAG: hypothetical protein ACXV8T_01445, partial [Acidimicrobiia bacterium]
MPDRPIRRRVKVAVAVTSALAVAALVATPALAHDSSTKKKGSKCQEMAGMDMCGNGVYHGKGGKATLKVGTMHVIDGALTGNSPCEKSGPPASVGQVKKDAEGHDHRGPLYQYPVSKADREQLIAEQTQARAVAEKYPTVASAEAAGYRKSTPYVPCIGAHYTNVGLAVGFNPAAPSELLYDGTRPNSRIVGLSYLVYHPGGAPAGFAGPNDHWHQHTFNGGLCIGGGGLVIGAESTSAADCEKRGGHKIAL